MFSGNVLSVSAPITGNYNTYGYVADSPSHQPEIEPVPERHPEHTSTLHPLSCLACLLIILLVFTQTVYLPLRKITVGANEYAAGNLDLPDQCRDTTTRWVTSADTLNYMSE